MKVRDIRFFNNTQILHADQILINNKSVEAEEVTKLLTSFKKKFFKVELINQQVSRTFEIDVDIIDEDDIHSIDILFFEMLSGDDVKDQLVDKFIDICEERFPNATAYTDALVKYLQGIKAKDGLTEHISFEQHTTKLNQALDTLKWFNSELSNSLISLIEFNFNRFDYNYGKFFSKSLESSILFFNGDIVNDDSNNSGSSTISIPIDRVTYLIVNSILNMFSKHDFRDIDAMATSVKKSGLTGQDRAKLNFILYRKAVEEGLTDNAAKLEKILKHDEVFQHILAVEN